MEQVFLSFLNRSIAAGWLVLALVLLRPALKKVPKAVRCLLWDVRAWRQADGIGCHRSMLHGRRLF